MRHLFPVIFLIFASLPAFAAGTTVTAKSTDLPQNIETLLSRKDTVSYKRWIVVHTKDGKKHRGYLQPFVAGSQAIELREDPLPKRGASVNSGTKLRAIALNDVSKVRVRRARSKWFAIVPVAAMGVVGAGILLFAESAIEAGLVGVVATAPVGLAAGLVPSNHTVLVEP